MRRIIIFAAISVLTITMSAQSELIPDLVYSKEPAKISGVLKGMDSNGRIDSITIISTPQWSSDSFEKKVKVETDGCFTVQLDVCVTSQASLRIFKSNRIFYVTPGQEVRLTVDCNTQKITCEGPLAELNTDLANYYDEFNERKLNAEINGMGLSKLKGMNVSQYGEKMISLYNQGIDKLNDAKQLSPQFREYMTPLYQYVTFALMTGYDKILRYANGGQGDYTRPDNYYDKVKDWNFTSKKGFIYAFGSQGGAAERAMFESAGGKFVENENLKPLSFAKRKFAKLEKLEPLTDNDFEEIKQNCPVFEDLLRAKNEETKAQVAANEENNLFNIKQIPTSLKGEDVFKAIVADYKGKMVLVDFWATWCGPCKAAMKTIQPVKEELWSKVAFVYVTGVTSPQALWNKMIPDIHGDHYYVTAEQWETLLHQFESQGIPTYVIVDKEGNVVTKHIGYPGNEVIKEELSK